MNIKELNINLIKLLETENDADEYDFQLNKDIKDEIDKCLSKIVQNLGNYYSIDTYSEMTNNINTNMQTLTKVYKEKYLPNIIKLQDLDDSSANYEEDKEYYISECNAAKKDMKIIVNNLRKLSNLY